jgi:hypothetical protein
MKYNVSNSTDIKKVIGLLEDEVEEQKQMLVEQVSVLYDSFSPVNVVKDVFREVVTSEEFRGNLLTATMGISAGYLTRKLLFKKNNNILKALSGNLLQYGIANLIVNPTRVLKTIFLPLLELISGSKGKEL